MGKFILKIIPLIFLVLAIFLIGIQWMNRPDNMGWLLGILITVTLVFYSVVYLDIKFSGAGISAEKLERAQEKIYATKKDIYATKKDIEEIAIETMKLSLILGKAVSYSSMQVGTPPTQHIDALVKILHRLSKKLDIDADQILEDTKKIFGTGPEKNKQGITPEDKT